MSFATDYLAQLEAFAASARLPRVRALHLPPERTVRDNRGEFCALELDDGSLGLSYVLLDDTLARLTAHAAAHPWLTVVAHRHQCGQSTALSTGVRHAAAPLAPDLHHARARVGLRQLPAERLDQHLGRFLR